MIDMLSELCTSVVVPRWAGGCSILDDEGSKSTGETGGETRGERALVSTVSDSRVAFRVSTSISASAEESLRWLLGEAIWLYTRSGLSKWPHLIQIVRSNVKVNLCCWIRLTRMVRFEFSQVQRNRP